MRWNINSTNTRKRVASRDLEKAPPGSLNFILCKLIFIWSSPYLKSHPQRNETNLVSFLRSQSPITTVEIKFKTKLDQTSLTSSSLSFLVRISACRLATSLVQILKRVMIMHGRMKMAAWTRPKSIEYCGTTRVGAILAFYLQSK